MKISPYRFLPLALAIGFLPFSLFGVEVRYESEPPEGIILSHELPADTKAGSITWRRTSDEDRTDVGQAFTLAEDCTLQQIAVYTPGASTSQTERPFTIVIEEYDGFRPDSPRTVVATESGILPDLNLGSKHVIFTLATPLPLKGEVLYSFRLIFDDNNPTSSMALRTINGVFEDKFSSYVKPAESEKIVVMQQNLEFRLVGHTGH